MNELEETIDVLHHAIYLLNIQATKALSDRRMCEYHSLKCVVHNITDNIKQIEVLNETIV